jgi:hypothetical protein
MFKAAKKLLRWAKRTGYLGIDLMDDMERPESESSKEYLKIADFERLLRCCAGIDPLPPTPADLNPQYIHIRNEVAKQTRRDSDQRFIPLEPAVAAW